MFEQKLMRLTNVSVKYRGADGRRGARWFVRDLQRRFSVRLVERDARLGGVADALRALAIWVRDTHKDMVRYRVLGYEDKGDEYVFTLLPLQPGSPYWFGVIVSRDDGGTVTVFNVQQGGAQTLLWYGPEGLRAVSDVYEVLVE